MKLYKEYFSVLNKVKLFKTINENDLISMLNCLNAEIKVYEKNNLIIKTGDKIEHIGIVLDGNVHIKKENFEGERTIIATLTSGDYFAEAFCCAGVEQSPVSVVANSESVILILAFSRILNTCSSSCLFHKKLIENMLYLIANKNIFLQNRIDILSQRSLRMKIITYLHSFKNKAGEDITIPFNREEFADFLCVDRSSLSHELARMKKESLIDYNKNHFIIL